MEITRYLPFLTVGLVIWNFVSTVIIEGCETFLSAQNVITQVRMPFWFTLGIVYRNLIVLAHNMVIVPLVLIIFRVSVDWTVIVIVPALAVLTINGIWLSILLGMISARYRDVPLIVVSLVQVIFFITPIFWPPEALGIWMQALPLNPLFAAVDWCALPFWRGTIDVFVDGVVPRHGRRMHRHLRAVCKISISHHLLDLKHGSFDCAICQPNSRCIRAEASR